MRSRQKTRESLQHTIREILFKHSASNNSPITEVSLAERLGVSRTPVREALKQLDGEHIIVRKKRQGIFLRRPTIKELVEVYDVRTALEGFAGRIAAKKIGKKEIAELERIEKKISRAAEQGNDYNDKELEELFHQRIIDWAGNSILERIVEDLHVFRRAFLIYHTVSLSSLRMWPHKKIIEAFKLGDPDKCEAACRFHVQNAKKVLLEQAMDIHLDPYDTLADSS